MQISYRVVLVQNALVQIIVTVLNALNVVQHYHQLLPSGYWEEEVHSLLFYVFSVW